jgi:hypothetical protein
MEASHYRVLSYSIENEMSHLVDVLIHRPRYDWDVTEAITADL